MTPKRSIDQLELMAERNGFNDKPVGEAVLNSVVYRQPPVWFDHPVENSNPVGKWLMQFCISFMLGLGAFTGLVALFL